MIQNSQAGKVSFSNNANNMGRQNNMFPQNQHSLLHHQSSQQDQLFAQHALKQSLSSSNLATNVQPQPAQSVIRDFFFKIISNYLCKFPKNLKDSFWSKKSYKIFTGITRFHGILSLIVNDFMLILQDYLRNFIYDSYSKQFLQIL